MTKQLTAQDLAEMVQTTATGFKSVALDEAHLQNLLATLKVALSAVLSK